MWGDFGTYAQATPAHARARPKRQKSENPRPNTPVSEANGRVWARIFRFLAFWTQSGRGAGVAWVTNVPGILALFENSNVAKSESISC